MINHLVNEHTCLAIGEYGMGELIQLPFSEILSVLWRGAVGLDDSSMPTVCVYLVSGDFAPQSSAPGTPLGD